MKKICRKKLISFEKPKISVTVTIQNSDGFLKAIDGVRMEVDAETTQQLIDIVSLLKVYRVYNHSGLIRLRRLGKDHDGGYVVPEFALEKADVIFGYGIGDDISFEDSASQYYGKRSYGFDGTVDFNQKTHSLCQFFPICIISEAERERIVGKPTKASSFKDHLDMLHVQDKKIFVKMDIETAEYAVMPDILKYSDQLTGITLEIHFDYDVELIPKALHLLKLLANDFILVHVHGNNRANLFQTFNAKGNVPRLLELSYIHKSLIDHSEVSPNQYHPTKLDKPSDPNYPEFEFEIIF